MDMRDLVDATCQSLRSKSVRILDIIEDEGPMSFTQIQRRLWEMSHSVPFTRRERGYWCTNLLGGMRYHEGLLNVFCAKNADGLWFRNAVPHDGHPWRKLSRKGKGT